MSNEKIVLTEELLNELSNIIKSGANMEKKGKEIRIKAENILNSFATYGVEIPNKMRGLIAPCFITKFPYQIRHHILLF